MSKTEKHPTCPTCGEATHVVRSVFPGQDAGETVYSCMVVLRSGAFNGPRREHHEFYERDLSEESRKIIGDQRKHIENWRAWAD